MLEVSPHTKRALYKKIYQEIKPSILLVNLKVALGLGAGSLGAWLLWEQFSVAMAVPFSFPLAPKPVQETFWAMASYSGFFAITSVICLRFLCSPLQFRAIIRRHVLSLFAYISAYSLVLCWARDLTSDNFMLTLWLGLTCILTITAARLVDFMVRPSIYFMRKIKL